MNIGIETFKAQPERRVFFVEVGDMTADEAAQHLKHILDERQQKLAEKP